jgi:hypothetical protein
MDYTFRFVWRRSLSEDWDYLMKRVYGDYTQLIAAITEQIQAEVGESPEWAGRLRLSKAIVMEEDNYFCLAEVDFQHENTDPTIVQKAFIESFQLLFDDHAAAGDYQLVYCKSGSTYNKSQNCLPYKLETGQFVKQDWYMPTLNYLKEWPVPPWFD